MPTIYKNGKNYSSGVQIDDSLSTTSENPVQNKIVTAAINARMQKGIDYVTAGQLAESTLGTRATAEGIDTVASGNYSHAEGYKTTASGIYSHAEGASTSASGSRSHAEGNKTSAWGRDSHAEGADTYAYGSYSHAEGSHTSATYSYSHAEGAHTLASSNNAHAEGSGTSATYKFTHSEGNNTLASGQSSHSEGDATTASGFASHAEGNGTYAKGSEQHVSGKYNIIDNNNTYAEIIGNGTDSTHRSNARTLDWNGNETLAGDLVYNGDISLTDNLEGAKTATGNPITVTDAAPVNAVNLSMDLEPIQDLHGYDHPWVGGAGKNKLPMTVDILKTLNTGGTWVGNVYSRYNTTFTVLTDSANNVVGIQVAGTPTNDVSMLLNFTGQNGVAYTLSGCPSGGSNSKYRIDTFGTGVPNTPDYGNGATFTASGNSQYVRLLISSGYAIQGSLTFYPMIRLSTETDSTFEPYTNICPISGRTDVKIKVQDTLDNPTSSKTYTIQLGSTSYGGTLDVTKGRIDFDRGSIEFDGSSDESLSYTDSTLIITNISPLEKSGTLPISNQYKSQAVTSWTELKDFSFSFHPSNGNTLRVKDSRNTSLADWKTYLASNPLQVCYELATPYTIDLTPQQIKMLENTNTIYTDYEGDTITIEYQPNNAISEAVRVAETIIESSAMIKGVDYVTAGLKSGSTLGLRATAEGYNTVPSGSNSHAEGGNTTASGNYSHAEGYGTKASTNASHSEGNKTQASGNYSHAEGSVTTASGFSSHAEGSGTSSSGDSSHAEGGNTTASGNYSHAEGYTTMASGEGSHAEGNDTIASGECSHAEGYETGATNYASHSCGHYNAAMTTGGAANNTNGTAFVIGNGTSLSALKNAFSVQFNGVVKAASTITASTTADYAEFFEWSDENLDDEDRVGLFVTNSEDDPTKIRIASNEDDYILGIVSGDPFVLGNGDCDVWNGMVMRDDFGRVIYEPAQKYEFNPETGEEEPVYDDEGNPVYEGVKPVYNPDYDPSIPYISRFDRKEWAPIGMLGVLHVYDDGTCEVNGYCTVGEDGKATKIDKYDRSVNCYKVIARIKDNIIKVIFR